MVKALQPRDFGGTELPPRDFVEMMRSAIKEDEWMLYAHGAVMGFGASMVTPQTLSTRS